MREIKFRAWDRKVKTLFPVHELEFHKISHSLTKCIGYDDWDKDGYTMHGGGIMKYANGERYILMQYTGIKDKNGKEIYEGDIVLNDDNQRAIVKYDDVNAGYLLEFYELMGNGFCVGIEKVIGNIYENSELLEV